jgi:hypothetical protein
VQITEVVKTSLIIVKQTLIEERGETDFSCPGNLKKKMSGGELLELRLLDTQLLDTFCRKTTARHKFYQLLESS